MRNARHVGLVGMVPQTNSPVRIDRFVCLAAQPGATLEGASRRLRMTKRQGQYYRDAGVLLGLLEARSRILLATQAGSQYARFDDPSREILLKAAIGQMLVIQWIRAVVAKSHEGRITANELRGLLALEARLSAVTAGRRLSSLASLVRYSGPVATRLRATHDGWWSAVG